MGAIPPSAILSRKGIARYGGVSRTGPLRGEAWDVPGIFLGVFKKFVGKFAYNLIWWAVWGFQDGMKQQEISQSNLSGDTFSIEAPQNLLRTKTIF